MSRIIYCIACNKETKNPRRGARARKYCSNKCQGSTRKVSIEQHLSNNRQRQARYRAKNLRKIHSTANPEKIREIYKMCPKGHEVDHIVPLSLGGWHHEDNLQYLTTEQNRSKSNRYIG